jgi:UDP-N-acetylglucosamine/UDP-N-acetylgalactosamine diphosphorylase
VSVRAAVTRDLDGLRRRFAEHGQGHVFQFWDALDAAGRDRLARQAESIDLAALDRVRADTARLLAPGSRTLAPAPVVRLPERGGDRSSWSAARELGEELLASGRVGVMVVAGGQGTRLGFDGPKGTFPIGPVTTRSLFELQAQKIRGVGRRFGRPVPWYVMTSQATDAATRSFLERSDWFGLPKDDVFVFCQGMVPALDLDGQLLLERPDCIAEAPDGHGGSIPALAASGALDDMERRGIGTISYYQVDNPLARVADAAYLGFHAAARAEMSAKVVRKREPGEKMGVVARVGGPEGRVGIVEYTELDDAHRQARDPEGELVYWAGSIAAHVFETAFLRRIAGDATRCLPFHASAKKIACVDDAGRTLLPSRPNGTKLERFVFDALPHAARSAIVEVRRQEEYSPVKNAEGEDSPATARRALVAQYRAWLEAGGIRLPDDAPWIELDHSVIDGPDDARQSHLRDAAQAGDAIRIGQGAHA